MCAKSASDFISHLARAKLWSGCLLEAGMNPINQIALVHSFAGVIAVLFGLGLFLNALLFVPQAIAIWRTGSARGVSIFTFAGFNVMQAIGVIHGFLEHDLALAVGMLASLLTCGTVTILAVVYEAKGGSQTSDET
jgi:MtN3 and saliva related transmembrane protein